eukprot:TRINITY_DN7168_c0_g1_i2.p4 TRINITY_DN7168_c0_g1~~TRINITY_DN7168_c0_g1_i2.p4  ORF type:complete len:106 (-),score=2.67 TRINITY_DN7168_c0_g1_i2:70-387(-)
MTSVTAVPAVLLRTPVLGPLQAAARNATPAPVMTCPRACSKGPLVVAKCEVSLHRVAWQCLLAWGPLCVVCAMPVRGTQGETMGVGGHAGVASGRRPLAQQLSAH